MRAAPRPALWPALALCLLAPACKEEPSFDQRYDAAEEKIRRTAAEIDSDLRTAEPRQQPAAAPSAGAAAAAPQLQPQR